MDQLKRPKKHHVPFRVQDLLERMAKTCTMLALYLNTTCCNRPLYSPYYETTLLNARKMWLVRLFYFGFMLV